jgi:hypothetical protein
MPQEKKPAKPVNRSLAQRMKNRTKDLDAAIDGPPPKKVSKPKAPAKKK